jgi:hypothetical protein
LEQADFHDIKVVITGRFTMNLRRALDFWSSDAGLDTAKRMEWFYRLFMSDSGWRNAVSQAIRGFPLRSSGVFGLKKHSLEGQGVILIEQ